MTSESWSQPNLDLAEISTRWTSIGDPVRFVMRYSRAIREYLLALLKNSADADDVSQTFFEKFIERGLPRADSAKGRFRDYLKVAARNAALTHLRKKRPVQTDAEVLQALPDETESEADQQWLQGCRVAILDRLWRSLDQHQRQNAGNFAFSVLQVTSQFPDEGSEQQAARVSQMIGGPLNAAAFRKQRSRARALAAEMLVADIRSTLEDPTDENLEAELAELELLSLVRDWLRPDA